MMITKAILAKELKSADLSYRAAVLCVDVVLESMAAALAKGERIELRGFGTFYISKQAERKAAINGGIAVPEHGRVVFRPCEKLKRSVWNYNKSK